MIEYTAFIGALPWETGKMKAAFKSEKACQDWLSEQTMQSLSFIYSKRKRCYIAVQNSSYRYIAYNPEDYIK